MQSEKKLYFENKKFRDFKKVFLKEDELDDALGLGDLDATVDANDGGVSATSGTTLNPSADTIAPTENVGIAQATDGSIEVDVTSLVQKQEDTLNAITAMLGKIDSFNITLGELVSGTTAQVQELERQIEVGDNELRAELQKRVPTPNEKMELQSAGNYPFNVKVDDYWVKNPEADAYKYDVAPSETPISKENDDDTKDSSIDYKLFLSDIMKDYDPNLISKTF